MVSKKEIINEFDYYSTKLARLVRIAENAGYEWRESRTGFMQNIEDLDSIMVDGYNHSIYDLGIKSDNKTISMFSQNTYYDHEYVLDGDCTEQDMINDEIEDIKKRFPRSRKIEIEFDENRGKYLVNGSKLSTPRNKIEKKPKKLTINQRFYKEDIIDKSLCQKGTYKRKMTKEDGVQIMQCKLKTCVSEKGSAGCELVNQAKLFDKKFFKKTKDNKIVRRM